jgi:hypothetical protein
MYKTQWFLFFSLFSLDFYQANTANIMFQMVITAGVQILQKEPAARRLLYSHFCCKTLCIML